MSSLSKLPVAQLKIGTDGFILQANAEYLLLLNDEMVVGRHRSTLCSDASRREIVAAWDDVLEGYPRYVEFSIATSDGTRWCSASWLPVLNAKGRVDHVVEYLNSIQVRLESQAQIEALRGSYPHVEILPDGRVGQMSDDYRSLLGIDTEALADLRYIHVAPHEHRDFSSFWCSVENGTLRKGEFKRIARDGRVVWLRSAYAPVRDPHGATIKVVEYVADITESLAERADLSGQIAAIRQSHCVISLAPDGTILDANDAFLEAMGYSTEDVVGRHHRMFVDPSYAHGAEYARFWRDLESGKFQSGEYRRLARGERPVWLQATYSPILDLEGRLTKIVEYALVVTDERLRQAEHQGQIAAIHKAQAVISFSLDGRIIDANDNFLDLMGYRRSEVRGQHHRMFVDDETSSSASYREFWQKLSLGEYQAGEFCRLAKDGREVWLQATYNPIFDMSGRSFRVIKYATDVTEERLKQAEHKGQLEAIHRSQGVISFDLYGNILSVNSNMLEMLGYSLDEVVGQHHRMFVDPQHANSLEYESFWSDLREGKFSSAMYKRLGKGGREVWIRATYNPIFDLRGRPTHVVKFATDVTSDVALADAFQDARQQAQHDSATALPNRSRLLSFISSSLASKEARLAILYIDLDRFKPVNDIHGHHIGDRLLGEVADRLRRNLKADQLAARIGGDEFVIVAPDFDEREVEKLAQNVIASISKPILIDGSVLSVGASIGISVAPSDGKSPDELLRCADAALYRSKGLGGAHYSFYSSEMNERLVAYRMLVEDMKAALERDEFYLEYQPRFDSAHRKINSVEALVRWRHPTKGRIAPLDFIPVAEKSGLIVTLGEWVLRKACEAVRYWPSIGISVNVSPVQFRHGDLVATVRSVLESTGIDASRLELEVTEGVLVDDSERAKTLLDELKSLGIRLAIDDFGTGYSSLSYLRNYPFDVLKIDRQFILDLEEKGSGRAVVQAILALAKALGLSVTAEGVETEAQLQMLTLDQCSEVQGYFLARPLSALKVTELMVQLAANPTRQIDVSALSDKPIDRAIGLRP